MFFTPLFKIAKLNVYQKMNSAIAFFQMKKTNPTICKNKEVARGYYTQWNKPGREIQVQMISLTSGEGEPRQTNEQNSTRFTEPKNGLTVTKGKGTGVDSWEQRD